jgi:hypothetical protein
VPQVVVAAAVLVVVRVVQVALSEAEATSRSLRPLLLLVLLR